MIAQRPETLADGSPAMRVVDEITRDAVTVDFLPDIASRWSVLTTPLALKGGDALASPAFLSDLNESMPWAVALIGFVGREVVLARGCRNAAICFPPVILFGEPAVGKSYAARNIARFAGLGFASLDVGGASDNRVLQGTSRGYTAATPAWPLVAIAAQLTGNPMLLVDELDKAGGSQQNGHVHHTLLSLTEPSTAPAWYDSCLLATADLGAISWVFCANDLSPIPKTLRSRVEVIEVTRPAAKWAGYIVQKMALELVTQLGLPPPAAEHLLGHNRVNTKAITLYRQGGTLRDVRRLLRAGLADHIEAIRRRLDH